MRLRLTSIVLLVYSSLYANNIEDITLQWLNSKERSDSKDLYILQFLKKESTSSQDAIDSLGQAYNVSNELFYYYAKRLKHDETTAVMECMQADVLSLIETNSDCIKAGLTLKKALTLTSLDLDKAILKIKDTYPDFAKQLNIINSPIPFSKLMASDSKTIYEIYFNSTDEFRINKLNYKIPSRTIEKIKSDKNFESLIELILMNPDLKLAYKSFFNIDDKTLSSKTSYLLAINHIKNDNINNLTSRYLENAYDKAELQINKDKILFLKYLLLNDSENLKKSLESSEIDIYK